MDKEANIGDLIILIANTVIQHYMRCQTINSQVQIEDF